MRKEENLETLVSLRQMESESFGPWEVIYDCGKSGFG